MSNEILFFAMSIKLTEIGVVFPQTSFLKKQSMINMTTKNYETDNNNDTSFLGKIP